MPDLRRRGQASPRRPVQAQAAGGIGNFAFVRDLDEDFRRIDIAQQPQTEAIAFAPNGAILYDSERQGDAAVPLYRQTCQKP